MAPDLSVRVGALHLRNPLIAASGCFGYGVEYAEALDLSTLGGVAVKGLFLTEREGHPAPRVVETPAGMLNAIGLQGIGVRRFVAEKLPTLRRLGATVVVNVCGTSIDEYAEVSRVLSDAEGVAAIELNISCPNIKEGGIQFGLQILGNLGMGVGIGRWMECRVLHGELFALGAARFSPNMLGRRVTGGPRVLRGEDDRRRVWRGMRCPRARERI